MSRGIGAKTYGFTILVRKRFLHLVERHQTTMLQVPHERQAFNVLFKPRCSSKRFPSASVGPCLHFPSLAHPHGLSPLPEPTFPTFTRPSIAQLLSDILEHCSNLSFLFLGLVDVFLTLSWLGSGSSVEVEDEFLGQLGD